MVGGDVYAHWPIVQILAESEIQHPFRQALAKLVVLPYSGRVRKQGACS